MRPAMRATTAALEDGIAAAQPGGRLGDVSAAIGVLGRGGGYGADLPGPAECSKGERRVDPGLGLRPRGDGRRRFSPALLPVEGGRGVL